MPATQIPAKRTRKAIASPAAPAATLAQQANQALLDSIRRLGTGQHLVGDQACVIHTSLGVDTLPVGSAPSGERARVYVYTDNPDAFSLLSLAAFLGIAQPLVEAAMQDVTVLKHSAQSLEVLALVPGHADSLNLLTHKIPLGNETAIVGQSGAPTTPPAPGQYWPEQGGTYAGVMRGAPGQSAYHLIVATGPAGMATDMAWGPEGKKIEGADCEWDGKANTAAIIGSGLNCPAAKFCASLNLEGHTDWYLPSRREQALCYANTPDQFEPRWHWSSTQYSAGIAWVQYFSYGGQDDSFKSYVGRCRAVRRLVLQSFNPLNGG